MIKRIYDKLYSSSGESITEVLVAALVIALGSILLASMITASFRIISNEEESYKEYIAEKNVFEKITEQQVSVAQQVTLQPSLDISITPLKRTVTVYKRQVSDDTEFYRYYPNELK